MSEVIKEFFSILNKKGREKEHHYRVLSPDSALVADPDRLAMFLASMGVVDVEVEEPESEEYLPDFRYVLSIYSYKPLHENDLRQAVARVTRVNNRTLEIEAVGNTKFLSTDEHMQVQPADSDEAKKLVGDERVKSLVTDFLDELEEYRKKSQVSHVVDEINDRKGFVTDANTLNVLGESKKRFPSGYFIVECINEGVYDVRGPFKTCPANYCSTTELPPMIELHRERRGSFLRSIMLENPLLESKMEKTPWMVSVMDDEGITYPVIVESVVKNDHQLEQQAKQIIEKRFDIPEANLRVVSIRPA